MAFLSEDAVPDSKRDLSPRPRSYPDATSRAPTERYRNLADEMSAETMNAELER